MLHRSGIHVGYREIPPQTANGIRKFGDLVRRCPLPVHIVGPRAGWFSDAAGVINASAWGRMGAMKWRTCSAWRHRGVGTMQGSWEWLR